MGFVRIFRKKNVQEAYLQKMSISEQIIICLWDVSQLYTENSIQTLLIFWGVDPKNLEGFVWSFSPNLGRVGFVPYLSWQQETILHVSWSYVFFPSVWVWICQIRSGTHLTKLKSIKTYFPTRVLWRSFSCNVSVLMFVLCLFFLFRWVTSFLLQVSSITR